MTNDPNINGTNKTSKVSTFNIFHDTAKNLNTLDPELVGKIMLSVFRTCGLEGEPFEFDMLEEFAFNTVLEQVVNYEEFKRQKAENGSKGGAPKGNSNASKTTKNNQKQPKTTSMSKSMSMSMSMSKSSSSSKSENTPAGADDTQTPVQFSEFVSMTNDEYKSLESEYGEHGVKRMIEILDNYKGSNGKTYKSDYRAIKSWVIERYQKELAEQIKASPNNNGYAYHTRQPQDPFHAIAERETSEYTDTVVGGARKEGEPF